MQVKSQQERLDIPNTEEEERRPVELIGMRHTAAGLIYEMLNIINTTPMKTGSWRHGLRSQGMPKRARYISRKIRVRPVRL